MGNRLTRESGGSTITYSYDAANQLETEEHSSGVKTYSYDDNGNLAVEVQLAGGRITYVCRQNEPL